jgi:hypothetical protein
VRGLAKRYRLGLYLGWLAGWLAGGC